MRIGSLFSGAGGLDMAVEEVFGGTTVWHSEIDKAASKVLAYRWPDVPNLGDITKVSWDDVPAVDILCGGFPCQDVSAAGKRAGIKDGTRSGLWSVFAEAIDILRPRFVVIENVRGLLSAAAERNVDGDSVEFGAAVVGDGSGRPVLRAMGAVLGTLCDIGYDAAWTTLAAGDVGAPHRRERVFILAADTDEVGSEGSGLPDGMGTALAQLSGSQHPLPHSPCDGWDEGRSESAGIVGGFDAAVRSDGPVNLLPTPKAHDGVFGTPRTSGRPIEKSTHLQTIVSLLPTPTASQGRNETSSRQPGSQHNTGTTLHDVVFKGEIGSLLPTPRSSDCFGAGLHGDGGLDLRTTITELAKENDATSEGRPREELRNLRDSADPQEVCVGPAGGPQRIPETDALLPGVCEQPQGGAAEHPRLACEACGAGGEMRGLRDSGEAARSPQRPESGQQRSGESGCAVCQLSSEAALAGGSGLSGATHSGVSWGKYEPAIRRWEGVLGRPAPSPTEPNKNGNPRLAAEFSSWLMGWPDGWVTDPAIGISRNDQLRIVGNGVCPQQAAVALRYLLAVWTGNPVGRSTLMDSERLLPTPCARDWKDGEFPATHARNTPSLGAISAYFGEDA